MARRALTGILLAGGRSSRFGSPKERATFEGVTLVERAWRLLCWACEQPILVGPGGLGDPGTGPVGAIAAGLRAARYDVAVVIPVDMPLLTVDALHELADACRDAAVAQHGPLPCAIRPAAFPDTDERRLRSVLAAMDTAQIALDENMLVNVNTPEELAAL
ncbi:MAG: molybdenum cofactor guanylyltransferase [Actinomycetota bacterium]